MNPGGRRKCGGSVPDQRWEEVGRAFVSLHRCGYSRQVRESLGSNLARTLADVDSLPNRPRLPPESCTSKIQTNPSAISLTEYR